MRERRKFSKNHHSQSKTRATEFVGLERHDLRRAIEHHYPNGMQRHGHVEQRRDGREFDYRQPNDDDKLHRHLHDGIERMRERRECRDNHHRQSKTRATEFVGIERHDLRRAVEHHYPDGLQRHGDVVERCDGGEFDYG